MSKRKTSSEKGRRGLLVVVSSPSGAGKTTLCHRLMKEFPSLHFSVSYTTRPARAGETHGKDYYFVSEDEFQEMVDAGEFVESAIVHKNRYGTTRSAVERALKTGTHVLFDIDWQGGGQLKSQFPNDAVMVWILPPSLKVLESRLRARATDALDVIEGRLAMAKKELEHFEAYEYLVVNDDLDRAYDALRSIFVAAQREIRRTREHAEGLIQQVREG